MTVAQTLADVTAASSSTNAQSALTFSSPQISSGRAPRTTR